MKRTFLVPAILLGLGLGGFIDGIVFHQILQTHSMLSAKLPQDSLINVKASMMFDGLFHLLTWILTITGLGMLWNSLSSRNRTWTGSAFIGAMILGWGIFNLVEGVIDHYLLQVHHVVETEGLSVYDHLYLFSGIVFIIAGIFMVKFAPEEARK